MNTELKKVMLKADRKCQELRGATPCVVWQHTNNKNYAWTCGSYPPNINGIWRKVTEFNSYYLDNLYSSEEIDNDFEKVWKDFIEHYSAVIEDEYNERITAYNNVKKGK